MGRKLIKPLEVLVEAVNSVAIVAADDDMVGRQVGQHSCVGKVDSFQVGRHKVS